MAPEWLLRRLCERSGTESSRAWQTTLRAYEGTVFRRYRSASVIFWIMHLSMYHRQRLGYGMQYCPQCLAEDSEPYFRRFWRVGFYVRCHRHRLLMLDRCPECGSPVAVHRLTMGHARRGQIPPLVRCFRCAADLRLAKLSNAIVEIDPVHLNIDRLCLWASEIGEGGGRGPSVADLRVLRHLVHLLTSQATKIDLLRFVLERTAQGEPSFAVGRIPVEQRSIEERVILIYSAMWLWLDLPERLATALDAGAIRYNHLLKDFDDAPTWYVELCARYSNWRDR